MKFSQYNYPSEPFGHCDIGTEMKVCSKCPNFPAKCAYQSKEFLKERYEKFVNSNEFKKGYQDKSLGDISYIDNNN